MARIKYKQLDLTGKIVNADLSTFISISYGGTGLTSLGSALQVLRVNAAGTALEYATLVSNPGTVTSVNFSGGTTGLTTSGGPITSSGTITLAGILATTNGGTGLSTIGTSLQVLRVNSAGTGLEYATLTQNPGTVTSVNVSGGSTGLTTSGGPITSSGTITINGTVNVGHGGTGLTAIGTSNQVLSVNSGGTALVYQNAYDLITLQPNVFTYIGNQINIHSTGLDNVGAPKVLFLPSSGGAFRAGNTSILNTRWNVSNIGYSSAAFGADTIASGNYSFATGWFSQATGLYSIAMGTGARAFGQYAFAVGNSTLASGIGAVAFNNSTASGDNSTSFNSSTASGAGSTAFGQATIASGGLSTTMGWGTQAKAYGGTSIGFWNDVNDNPTGDGTNDLSTDRIFQIGVGTSFVRKNAMTVLRSGNIGFNVLAPTEIVHIGGNLRFDGGAIMPNGLPGTSGQFLTSNGANSSPVWTTLNTDYDTLHWVKTNKDVKVDNTIVISGDYVLENTNLHIVGDTNEITVGALIFKEVGQIFIGGNLVIKDSNLINDGILSVGGGIIFIGSSTLTGTGVIN